MTQTVSRSRLRKWRRMAAGFTVLELLVVMVVTGLLAGMTVMVFNSLRPKMTITNASREIHSVFQKARLRAIRQNQTVVAVLERELGGDADDYNPDGVKNEWLVLKIVDNYDNETEINSYQLHRGYPPIHFWGDREVSIHGASANTFSDDTTFPLGSAVYNYDGSVHATGAVRISYAKEGVRNVMEIAVPSLSGIPMVRKYLESEDRPASANSQSYFEETVANQNDDCGYFE